MKFKAKIEGDKVTSIKIPPEVIEKLGAGKKPAVIVTLNHYTYRTNVTNMGGSSWIVYSKEHRKIAGIEGGQVVDVELVVDTEPKTVEVPPDFQQKLDKNKKAKERYEALSPSKKKNVVYLITSAKTQETRDKRIAKAMNELSE